MRHKGKKEKKTNEKSALKYRKQGEQNVYFFCLFVVSASHSLDLPSTRESRYTTTEKSHDDIFLSRFSYFLVFQLFTV